MENCVFCKIVNKEIPKEFVFQNGEFAAFYDLNPKAPVHLLVIPKKHCASVREASGELLGKVVETAKKIAAERGLEGYKLIFNVGRKGGQVIDHLHLHLVGGWVQAPGKVEV